MGCDYISDENGIFKASIVDKNDCLKTIRTIEIKGSPFNGIYRDQVDYNEDTEDIEVEIGTYR